MVDSMQTDRNGDTAATVDIRRVAAGVLLFVLAAQFMTVIMLAASMSPVYDLSNGAISDLGVDPATAAIFNLSLIATGVLNIAAGLLLYLSERRIALVALQVIAGIGAMGAGVFTLGISGLHGIFALLAFLFFNLQALAAAYRLSGAMRWLGLSLGFIGLFYVVVMFVGDAGNATLFGPIGHGGTERMIVYPPMLWLMVFGGYLIGTGGGTIRRRS